MNNRRLLAQFGIVVSMVVFFAGMNRLEGDRAAQALVAVAYAIAVYLLARQVNRRAT